MNEFTLVNTATKYLEVLWSTINIAFDEPLNQFNGLVSMTDTLFINVVSFYLYANAT